MTKKSISSIVEKLGGTSSVAALCEVSSQAVSQWKLKNRIPKARLQFLKLLNPDAFEQQHEEQESA